MAVEKLKRDALAGNGDMLKWFTFMATDISGELSFGKSFGMLEQGKVSGDQVELKYTISNMFSRNPPTSTTSRPH